MASAERGPSGLYRPSEFELEPFDIDLLKILPNVGATKGRYMADALTVQQIRKALDPALTSNYISLHLRRMMDEGLVARIHQTARQTGWQRTPQGAAAVEPRNGDEPS